MTGFRFLHLADLHLETSFGGRATTRERLRRAALEAFEAAVDFAIESQLHAVLAAGDLYDDPLLSIQTELALQRQVQRLEEAGVWFLAVCGNHDPGGPEHRSMPLGLETNELGARRERVHVFRERLPEPVTVTNRKGEPVGLVVGAGHASATEASNLAAAFPSPRSELAVVGLLHSHVENARSASDHDRYAPSGREDFERAGYSYWALGHIHRRQRAVPGAPVYYAGNLQGRNARETGPKGGLVVEARPGIPAEPEFVRFAPIRWERLRVDALPDSRSAAVLVAHLSEQIDALTTRSDELIVRVELSGETPLAQTLRSARELESFEHELQRKTGALQIELRNCGVARPIDRSALRDSSTETARALELIERASEDDLLLEELAPRELATPLDPDAQIEYLRGLLADLPEELIERSLSTDDA
jgi:DNA repair exonuclease SbcCD nuclease subunit